MDKKQLQLLQQFTQLCKSKPDILHLPELSFFKEWLSELGAKIPPPPSSPTVDTEPAEEIQTPESPKRASTNEQPTKVEVEESSEESDLELDTEGVIEGDTDVNQEMGDADMEVTDEMMEQSADKLGEAMGAVSEGDLDKALALLTEAIKLNPLSAGPYAKRASVFFRMKRPNACIRDCDKALDLNPDSAQAYKWRGKSHKLLGHFEFAGRDLMLSNKLDYDDGIYMILKEMEPTLKKIQEHKRKYERKREEKEIRERRERVKRAKEAEEKARKEQEEREKFSAGGMPGGFPGGFPGGMPGGFPGGGMPGGMGGGMPGGMGGGMPGGMGGGMPGGPGADAGPGGMPPGFADILKDPEIMTAFQDPEVMAAMADVQQNPSNIFKYKDNPKIQRVLEKLSGGAMKSGFGPGGPGGPAGGSPPPPRAGDGWTAPQKPPSSADDVD